MSESAGWSLSTVVLPHRRWADGAREDWRLVEELGFDTAYTYDHLSWRSFRGGPWFGAVTTLAAAAAVTSRIRLGTLVISPNFRHPVPLAKELVGLDDLSGGRITAGVGAGGTGFDATALGQEPWSARERGERFEEFVALLDRLLTEPVVTHEGRFYSAHEAENVPGCVQRPRLPLAVAATGPRGLALAARHGQAWVTYGDPRLGADATPEESTRALAGQLARVRGACEAQGRDPATLHPVLLTGSTPEGAGVLSSYDAFLDFAGRHLALGFREVVVHLPVPESVHAADPAVFERVALEARRDLAGA
ncbi:LLM class flavin-dependent oxidoreductase [Nocardioides marmoribigeumensis]|uniref:Alkanesulfonate monooxygenase SsuD/methylene tetrahydromethanopterin reductase-like flavin-dependent oxidoreductase (Luciferase family) n=1 Tax=Nocardioides marmoribigeumensis TaxID=433649 RepID=A0ABU2BRK2_9ACTN|nr:LLM class flavin-dependent oxidoreductase [Nocardioides marmoribigeumensis]MDR7360906.1 alkanesulfonate monooxygenase SsuD/methylene tetrahydromethanopterin reductase-like flavin-dependent oxidoreductase (luciferase family) [Nocardioides marmoribigeumensis]